MLGGGYADEVYCICTDITHAACQPPTVQVMRRMQVPMLCIRCICLCMYIPVYVLLTLTCNTGGSAVPSQPSRDAAKRPGATGLHKSCA